MVSPEPPTSRAERWAALSTDVFDVVVVGAGINGAVTAAALAARGVRVALLDRGDFAGQTSMHSSNLAWGGIKYMETLEFGLVRKLCLARNRLMRAYPHAVRETRFLTTVPRAFRLPRWVLYFGAWLYWWIGSRFTQTPRLLSRAELAKEQPQLDVDKSVGGFEYSDAHLVDGDARFVFGFVRGAIEAGALALNYAQAVGSQHDGALWRTQVRDGRHGDSPVVIVRSRTLVNACGPFADAYNAQCGIATRFRHVLSKGVHLIVRRLTERSRVMAFFASDGRLFFAIPMGHRSCIGTTDSRAQELPARTTEEDRRFILSNINAWLRLPEPLTTHDIIAERCGVRPLVMPRNVDDPTGAVDWTQLSRKHVVEIDAAKKHITIFGGKLTDCLNVGEELTEGLESLGIDVPRVSKAWFGEEGADERSAFLARAAELALPPSTADRLFRCYGTRADTILRLVRKIPALATPLYAAADVIAAEARYAGAYELVETLEDFLRRRTQLAQLLPRHVLNEPVSLRTTAQEIFGADAEARIEEYLALAGEA